MIWTSTRIAFYHQVCGWPTVIYATELGGRNYMKLSLSLPLSIFPSLYIYLSLYLYLSHSPSIYSLSTPLSIYPSLCLPLSLSTPLSIYPSLYLPLSLSIYSSLYIYLSLSLPDNKSSRKLTSPSILNSNNSYIFNAV